ncbi:MAG: Smr/MutS family protein [Pseudomonadota bacterium]|nr:Smr/MutS family protein [Pseudomonadota bacterium]
MKKARAKHEAREDIVFREAVKDVRPMAPANRIEPFRRLPAPHPAKRIEDERAVLAELANLATDGDDVEFEDDGVFLRTGLPRDILRKLRRTHWVIQASLDLHGLTGDEAVAETAVFLAGCKRSGVRCVRIIHGKGLRSPGKEPVLKRRIRKLLTRRDEVLAFAEPRAVEGGGGAVVVLLEA